MPAGCWASPRKGGPAGSEGAACACAGGIWPNASSARPRAAFTAAASGHPAAPAACALAATSAIRPMPMLQKFERTAVTLPEKLIREVLSHDRVFLHRAPKDGAATERAAALAVER